MAEAENQAGMLKKLGCDQVQGYYYGCREGEISEDAIGDRPLDITPRLDRPLIT